MLNQGGGGSNCEQKGLRPLVPIGWLQGLGSNPALGDVFTFTRLPDRHEVKDFASGVKITIYEIAKLFSDL